MKNKYLLLFFVMILVSMCYFYFSYSIIDKKVEMINRIDKDVKKDQQKLNSARVLNVQLKGVSNVILNSIGTDNKYFASEINEFVHLLSELADKHQIPITSFFPKGSNKEGNFIEQKYSIEVICNYVQLGRYLAEIERLDLILDITNLNVRLSRKYEKKNLTSEIQEEAATLYRVLIELSTFKIVKEA